jgi:Cu+-exporting ATPase
VEKALRTVPGVKNARVNLVTQQAVVQFTGSDVVPEKLIQAVVDAGYQAELIPDEIPSA